MASPQPPDDPNPKFSGKRVIMKKSLKQLKSYLHISSPDTQSSSGSLIPPSAGQSVTPSQSTVSEAAFSRNETRGDLGTSLGPPIVDIDPAPVATEPEAKDETVDKLKQASIFGLDSALRALYACADVAPPLKPAIGEFLACLDTVQAATKSTKEYNELTSELKIISGTLKDYLGELIFEDPGDNPSYVRIAKSIEEEVAHIKKQQGRSKIRRALESATDQDDVIHCYHRVEGLFRQLQSDISLRTLRNTNRQNLMTLLERMSPVEDALYNSAFSTTIKRQGCTRETREQVQADLQHWVQDSEGAKVYWMNGMAGTGKTTIAYSLCEWLADNQRLGGSFFCSRASPECRNVNSVVPTVAHQLAQYSSAFRAALGRILKDNPGISKLNVVQQFENLIWDPILAVKAMIPKGTVIVIDALDECQDDYGVRLILEVLLRLAASMPLKFFVTSRPEPSIRHNMLYSSGYSPNILYLHDIEQSIVEKDIERYLMEALGLLSPPITTEQLGRLVKLSGRLFIYAATVVRYILPGNPAVNSTWRLEAILEASSQASTQKDMNRRYKQLDDLYAAVLIAAFDEELEPAEVEVMQLVLWTVVCAQESITVSTIASLLSFAEQQVSSVLQPLLSVLHVSESNGLVSTLHSSFPDYMLDPSRSGKLYCNQTSHHSALAQECFKVMKAQLRFNICDLKSSNLFDRDVLDLDQKIKTNISPSLTYSSLHWGSHVNLAAASEKVRDMLVEFLSGQLLFWMEVLNVLKSITKGILALDSAEAYLLVSNASEGARRLATDAMDFVTRFAAGGCSHSTPHIYVSALPFCVKSSSVYELYYARMQGLMNVQGTTTSQRNRGAQATWMTDRKVLALDLSADSMRVVSGDDGGAIFVRDARTGETVAGPFKVHTSSVYSVAFSPDGTWIASGSHDTTVIVWDARTGEIIAGPFKGNAGSVYSVNFSPDGGRVASTFDDKVIQIWDVCNKNIAAQQFSGHTDSVNSVSFSPDGALIASGSSDRTIRVWDSRIGNLVAEPFQGHEDAVWSVAFSSDGTRIASGSDDCTVRVWDPHTGDIIAGPLQGHINLVNCVTFFPDSVRIASGSYDKTICVWDVHTGDIVAGPFHGHTNWVNSIRCSPDGTHIVSCSSDQTIRLWDVRTRDSITQHFTGHTDTINSVAFSPDNTCIASGSDDQKVRVWDPHNGTALATPFQGHTGPVTSIGFSPDSTRIVTGSDDQNVRVWDSRTGIAIAGPFMEHMYMVTSVAFSPDGTRIVSGSGDQSILVWDAVSGEITAGPFIAHSWWVKSVAFSPEAERIVSAGSDNNISVWDARTGGIIAGPFRGHDRVVNSVSFSPDGTRIVSGSCDRTVQVRNSYTGEVVAGPLIGHMDEVHSISFSPDGACIVSSSSDRTILVWDSYTGDLVAGPLRGHTGPVKSVAFSPDGTRIVSGSNDQVIRIWDYLSGPSDFQPNDDGWFTNDKGLIFWVPLDLYSHIPHPCNSLVIGPYGTTFIDYSDVLLGERWLECYPS